MSERDTPETDAFYDALYAPNVPEDLRRAVDAQEREYARRLERQRDELADVLAARVEKAEADARRYRFIRKREEFPDIFVGVDGGICICSHKRPFSFVFIAINAALSREENL